MNNIFQILPAHSSVDKEYCMKKKHYHELILHNGLIGIERETLRVNPDGTLAKTDHPRHLGASLTHPHITTDYAESLLELITPPLSSPTETYQSLFTLHQFVRQQLKDESMWPASMPCILPKDDCDIRIAEYGNSLSGRFKNLYRRGLALRYGKPMQMIAGVHFNYSPAEDLWQQLADIDGEKCDRNYINRRYMGMLRSLQKLGWLVCYLWGSSPACDISFRPAQTLLDKLGRYTLGWQHATTLRMSSLGYENKTNLHVSLNRLSEYLRDLRQAVLTPDERYQKLGLRDAYGNYQQISTHLLQIENEYYASARPKQPTEPEELPAEALIRRGIAYVELRVPDINPYDPCGISLEQIHCLETLMLYALLHPAPYLDDTALRKSAGNRYKVACCGLDPELRVYWQNHEYPPRVLAEKLLNELSPIAQALDKQRNGEEYSKALQSTLSRLEEDDLPAKRVQRELHQSEYIEWALKYMEKHDQILLKPLDQHTQHHYQQLAEHSLEKFYALPQATAETFDQYIQHYLTHIQHLTDL